MDERSTAATPPSSCCPCICPSFGGMGSRTPCHRASYCWLVRSIHPLSVSLSASCTWAVRLLFWAAAFFCLVCLFAEAVAKLFALYASARHSNGVPCGASASFCLSYPGLALPITVTHCRLRAHEHWLHPINSTFKYMYLIVLNLWTSTAALIVHRY